MIDWMVPASLSLTLVVSQSPEATTPVLLISSFQHSNLHTPRWLGDLIQRPESQSRHHERGVPDTGNHSNLPVFDLPLFDLVFSAFDNPRALSAKTGLWDGYSGCWWQMLGCQDIATARLRRTQQNCHRLAA